MLIRVGEAADIKGILAARENLYTNLSESERTNGFVTTPFTKTLIHDLLLQTGVLWLKTTPKFLVMHLQDLGVLFTMGNFPVHGVSIYTVAIQRQQITVQNSFQYGPVCLDLPYEAVEFFHNF
jgi:hypothetical protein